VTTNILGIFTMPFLLPHIAAASALIPPPATAGAAGAAAGSVAAAAAAAAAVTLEPLPLMLQLCQTILVPTLLGAAVRGLVPGAAGVIDRHKKVLSYINAGLLASVPWMQVGFSASGFLGFMISPGFPGT
jgi:sodium/bile acid cotransporter 7